MPNKRVNLTRLARRTMQGNRRAGYAPHVRCTEEACVKGSRRRWQVVGLASLVGVAALALAGAPCSGRRVVSLCPGPIPSRWQARTAAAWLPITALPTAGPTGGSLISQKRQLRPPPTCSLATKSGISMCSLCTVPSLRPPPCVRRTWRLWELSESMAKLNGGGHGRCKRTHGDWRADCGGHRTSAST